MSKRPALNHIRTHKVAVLRQHNYESGFIGILIKFHVHVFRNLHVFRWCHTPEGL